MTIEEIRIALRERGWTQRAFAKMLHVHPVTLGLILTGKNKLTAQLEAHMELLLNLRCEQLIIHKVTLPAPVVQRWMPGIESLTPELRTTAMKAVLQDAALWLITEGRKQLSEGELADISNFYTTLCPPSCSELEYDCEDSEGELLSAADELRDDQKCYRTDDLRSSNP